MIRRLVLAAVVFAVAGPALAHEGDHSHVGLSHLLEPDHLAMLLGAAFAFGLGAFAILRRRAR